MKQHTTLFPQWDLTPKQMKYLYTFLNADTHKPNKNTQT